MAALKMETKSLKKMTLVVTMAFGLTACQGDGVNEGIGTLIGAGLGAWLGSEIDGGRDRGAGMVIGYMAGAMIGNSVGKKLDQRDRLLAGKARHFSLEKTSGGVQTDWYNPDSGHRGYYIPEPAIKDEQTGRYCREYTQVVTIGGKEEKAYGQACRQVDGSWEIVDK
ncbi:RT0821/Lpp0805 family surface protein [Temperatibacter marinus]|uniref:17 kDa surface antigen n=1 Tax=Temperatibacter marinus TaxID=1456591 RepID=A0AA52H994_9PROT|nr:RT0821/Lpp0805 family surface protein [Temperatibacter marinus]WND02664.1 RT0821/Lpp0805 family surface protein [Temperatibacter marinus]